MKLKKFALLFFFRFFPPLWLWFRSTGILVVGVIFYIYFDKTTGKIFLILSVIHLFAYSVTRMCQTVERKLLLFLKPKQKKKLKKK